MTFIMSAMLRFWISAEEPGSKIASLCDMTSSRLRRDWVLLGWTRSATTARDVGSPGDAYQHNIEI